MRFENDYIRIIIEKKELTIEKKEELGIKWKRRRPAMLIALLLIVAIIGSVIFNRVQNRKDEVQQAQVSLGTASKDESPVTEPGGQESDEAIPVESEEEYGKIEGEYITTEKLAAGLHEKYADRNLYNYTLVEPIEDVARTQQITFELGYDVTELGIEYWTEVFALYEDPALTQTLGCKFSFDAETKTFIMGPSEAESPCEISMLGLDVETVSKYPHNLYYLFDKGAGTSWGNLGTAYLASYRDKETGELLEKPEVSIVTFAGEIEDTPKLNYSITEDGRPNFYWNEVEGADEYMVCRTSRTNEIGYGSMKVLGITDELSWTTEPAEFDSWTTTNTHFKTFKLSQDDWNNESSYDKYLEDYGEPDIPYYPEGEYTTYNGICVIAVNQEGTSMISNVYTNEELAPNLPYAPASHTRKKNGIVNSFSTYESVEQWPVYDYVTMCDGYTVSKLVEYDTENGYIQNERFMLLDEETGEVVGGETVPCLHVPYHVQGTPFYYEYTISYYDEAKFEEDMAFLAERQAALTRKSGDVAPEFALQFAVPDKSGIQEIRKVDTEVFANSALSEYLATNMLGGASVIELDDFPEARDTRVLDDAFLEAYYQNPLILGIKGYRISKNGEKIRIVYEENLEDQAEKQEEIRNKVEEIIAEIITDDMTDREKELAINQYLCDTVVYDYDALDNAAEHDYQYTDDEFKDSFTAYGALIDGKCVCAGYSAAFQLLARAAGLEAIVVTGNLDGSLAHAWNKVKIDGEWHIVDSTNNDNEYFFNALMNVPAAVGDRILVENKDFLMDAVLSEYTGDSEKNEYYHITDNYFPVQEVAEILADELLENKTATVRTDYELDDEDFYEITDAVYDIMGDEVQLYGYYWLGVIYLTTEEMD